MDSFANPDKSSRWHFSRQIWETNDLILKEINICKINTIFLQASDLAVLFEQNNLTTQDVYKIPYYFHEFATNLFFFFFFFSGKLK